MAATSGSQVPRRLRRSLAPLPGVPLACLGSRLPRVPRVSARAMGLPEPRWALPCMRPAFDVPCLFSCVGAGPSACPQHPGQRRAQSACPPSLPVGRREGRVGCHPGLPTERRGRDPGSLLNMHGLGGALCWESTAACPRQPREESAASLSSLGLLTLSRKDSVGLLPLPSLLSPSVLLSSPPLPPSPPALLKENPLSNASDTQRGFSTASSALSGWPLQFSHDTDLPE